MSPILVKIFTPQELNHSSYIQTGLFELEGESSLKTNVVLSFAKRLGTIRVTDSSIEETNQPHPKTSFYQLIDTKSGRTINFATDLYDASYSFSKYALEHCDYVFKRNFETHYVSKLPKEFQQKIYPLGLTFKVNSSFKKNGYKFCTAIFITNVLISIKWDNYFFSRLNRIIKNQIQHWKQVKYINNLTVFENQTNSSENSILFQTRCFSNENAIDVQQIHQQRYHLIKVLKEKFKKKFKGGFVPSEIANEKYQEALTNLPTDSLSYLNLVRKAKIVVYTRGLVNSPAWKMAEYLSQAKIIVAEQLSTELPFPLTHRKEVLFFEDEQEMISLIEEALQDDLLCEKLSYNSKNYFDNHVNPKANVKRIINFMLSQKS
ncbi:hypothetical protein [Flavobacterium maritimum]|uniref:hypothetical protein n=1 Tax=Flavobacterium maritimum TaxID=3149042 RepID=UPI0032B54D00